MAATVEMVRRFAGADPEEDSGVLDMCLKAAVEWYAKAGVPASASGDLYDFWVANLAAWMYDNRGNADSNANIPSFIVQSVHQLRPARGSGG